MSFPLAPLPNAPLPSAGPFLKWAGGKSQLLPQILPAFPDGFGRYFEPFLGGGAVFFALRPDSATLSDVNAELIGGYLTVRDNVDALIEHLQGHVNTPEYFYSMRSLRPESLPPLARASRLIYLNRTCFNGLYRVNQAGGFNVPFGNYVNPAICQADVLRQASEALQGKVITEGDYRVVLERARSGDLVYLDPPYVALGGHADFKRYNESPFGLDDHRELAGVFRELDRMGVHMVLSNSDTPLTRELYSSWRIQQVSARRRVSGKVGGRQSVPEILVTNT